MPINEMQAAVSWWRQLSSLMQEQLYEQYVYTHKCALSFWQFKSNSYKIAKLWRLKGRPGVDNG